MQKFAIYELRNLADKEEYTVSSFTVCRSLSAAYRALDALAKNQGKPAFYNSKTREFQYYVQNELAVFVPDWTLIKDKYGDEHRYLLGLDDRFPIFYLGEYPIPYSSFKLYRDPSKYNGLILEGVKWR